MIIYRCDKCGKKTENQTDLYRIRAISEMYDDHWKENAKTRYFDVCKKCQENVLLLFVKQFLEEGADKEESEDKT